jgi:hypothetical protein
LGMASRQSNYFRNKPTFFILFHDDIVFSCHDMIKRPIPI